MVFTSCRGGFSPPDTTRQSPWDGRARQRLRQVGQGLHQHHVRSFLRRQEIKEKKRQKDPTNTCLLKTLSALLMEPTLVLLNFSLYTHLAGALRSSELLLYDAEPPLRLSSAHRLGVNTFYSDVNPVPHEVSGAGRSAAHSSPRAPGAVSRPSRSLLPGPIRSSSCGSEPARPGTHLTWRHGWGRGPGKTHQNGLARQRKLREPK